MQESSVGLRLEMSIHQPDPLKETVDQIKVNCSLACLSVKKYSDEDFARMVDGQLPLCAICKKQFLPRNDEKYCGSCLNNMG